MQQVIKQSPEYKQSAEQGEASVGKQLESQDLGSFVESLPEQKNVQAQPAAQQSTLPQATDLPSAPPVSKKDDVVARIRTRLFSGMDVAHESKEVLVNHLLIKHNFDAQLAYDLVEFLKLELADPPKSG